MRLLLQNIKGLTFLGHTVDMQVTAYIGCYTSSSRVGRSPLYERAANRAVPRNNRGNETSHGQCQASMQGSMAKRRRQLAHTGVTGSAIANMINLHRGKQTVDPIKSTGSTWQSPRPLCRFRSQCQSSSSFS